MTVPGGAGHRYYVLGAGQILSGLGGVPVTYVTVADLDDVARHLLGALAWVVLGLFTLLVAPRLGPWAFEASLLGSTVVVAYQVAIADRGQLQVLSGAALIVLGVFAALYLDRRGIATFLVVACVGFLVAVSLDQLLVSVVIGPTLLIMMVLNTILVRYLFETSRRLAVTDPLTGALNRIGLEETAPGLRALAQRSDRPTVVAFIDLDGFKTVNDTQGHAAGDATLVRLVEGWRASLRPSDLVARVGGDEFVVVLPGSTPEDAASTLHRLQAGSSALWTAGLAVWHDDEDVNAALDRADRLMYEAKQRTRARGVDPVARPD